MVSGVVPVRTTKDVLKNVKLSLEDGSATLIGTDQEVGIRYELEGVETDSAGDVLLRFRPNRPDLLTLQHPRQAQNRAVVERVRHACAQAGRQPFSRIIATLFADCTVSGPGDGRIFSPGGPAGGRIRRICPTYVKKRGMRHLIATPAAGYLPAIRRDRPDHRMVIGPSVRLRIAGS